MFASRTGTRIQACTPSTCTAVRSLRAFTPAARRAHIHGGAGFVVHLHGGHQNGVFIHQLQHLVHVQVAVRLRGHKLNVVALLGQALHGKGHAGVLKAGAHNALAPLAGAGRAQNGQVVPLRAAAGEVHLPRRGPQGAGHVSPGLVQGQLTVGAGGCTGWRGWPSARPSPS